MSDIIVAALYKFVTLEDCEAMRGPLQEACVAAGVRGTLLLAREGVNGTIAGTREAVDRVLAHLKSAPRLADIDHKESRDSHIPFHRMKVKLKREIVTLGVPGVNPDQTVGTYVKPEDWNALVEDPDVLVIDARNDYEVAIGSFRGAVDPGTTSFRDFPDWVRAHCDPAVQKRVAMFCTGGIRCEKASSFMLGEGFEEVYHLQGGILKYLETVPEGESAWEGECFVFDNRVSVNHRLEKGSYDQCHACRRPITGEDKRSPLYQEGVSCPHCSDQLTDEQRARFAERQKQVELATARNRQHIGAAQMLKRGRQKNLSEPSEGMDA